MAEHTFYAKKSRANQREVTLKTAVLLVGKDKTKRIKAKLQMPLSGKKMTGTPDWIVNALAFVEQSHDAVVPAVEFKGFDVTFSGDHLFGDKVVKAEKCSMKGFSIAECGDSDDPDVAMTFLVYMPFSDKLWRWCGQLGGEDMYAKFEQMETEESDKGQDDLELQPDSEEAEPPAEDGDDEGDDDLDPDNELD